MTLAIILTAWLLASAIGAVIFGRAIGYGMGTLPDDAGFGATPSVVEIPC